MTCAARTAAVFALLFWVLGWVLTACDSKGSLSATVAGGDEKRGQELVARYGCGSCHVIPGIAAVRGQVGPPLQSIARRVYLGGVLPNTPDNMIAWISHPQKVEPRTAMPDLGVPEPEARDMAAYLYTLK